MKFRFCTIFLCFSTTLFSQTLTPSPQTGRISIKDSIDVNDKSLQEVKEVMVKWAYTLIDAGSINKVYRLDNSKQEEKIIINLPLWSPLNQERSTNSFLTNGTLSYSKTKTSGLNALAPVVAFGNVKFDFSYTVLNKKMIYEFTNLKYSYDGVHFAEFESDKQPQNSYNRSLFLPTTGKKGWETIKQDYFNKLKILADNLKEYSSNFLSQSLSSGSLINYQSYKKIETGISYQDVIKILGDEGKEVSNASTQLNGKSVIQQTIIWYDLDKTKSITISFVDGKVISKAQSNL